METNGLPAAKPSARAPAPTGIPWGIQNEKERDLSPRQLRPRSKQLFQGAQTLASSQTQKSAKYLNSRYPVSIINSNLLMFRLPGLCHKSSYPSWLPTASSLNSFSELSEMLCSGLKSLDLTTKLNISFRLCFFFPLP